MEITVASNSPLGQYLAEINAEVENHGTSMTPSLSTLPKKSGRRDRFDQASKGYSWLKIFKNLRWRIELIALRRLIPELCAFHPSIREDIQQMVDIDPAVFSPTSKSRGKIAAIELLQGVDLIPTNGVGRSVSLAISILVVASGVMFAVQENREVGVVQILKLIAVGSAFVLLSLELSVKILLAGYKRRSRRLVRSLNTFVVVLEKFNEIYTSSLTLVKRAELASRGYRLGTGLLPPIGRLEASDAENGNNCSMEDSAATSAIKTQLRCLPLRRKLRMLNEQLRIRASLLESEQSIGGNFQHCGEEETNLDEDAPSLLLTTLRKQHNRAVLLLEHAVRTVLIRKLARACSSHGDTDWILFRTLDSQRRTLEQVNETLSTWLRDLEVWNTTRDPMGLLASVPDTKSSNQQQVKHVANFIGNDPRLKDIASKLHELRSISETLVALLVAAQHDLLPAESAAERLAGSRSMMQSMVQQLQEAWVKYDSALNTLTGKQMDNPDDVSSKADEDNDSHNLQPTTSLSLPSAPALEDPNCTVVFTGTSTGDEGFDLKAFIKQQQEHDATATASGPTPSFICELRNVLAHRCPGITKQVDYDPPIFKTPLAELSPPHGAATMFALPRAPPRGQPRRPPSTTSGNELRFESITSAVNTELQALLQRCPSPAQDDVFECLEASDKNDDVLEKKTGE